MALKLSYAKKELIPVDVVGLYAERDGAWHLEVDGVVGKDKLDEFRNNNVALTKQLQDLQKQIEGVDLSKLAEMRETQRKAEEGELLKKGDVDGLIANRLKTVLGPIELAKKQAEDELKRANERLAEVRINQAAVEAASKRGLNPKAIPDLTTRAQRVFRIENGAVFAYDASGNKIYGSDGVTPLSVDEWAERQVADAPHLFETNAGSGATGGGSGGAGGANGNKNPFKRGTDWNITRQMELQKKDPALAARLKAAA
jgi:hypothetical protein